MPIEWTETPIASPKPQEGDGEPCPHCGVKLSRLEAHRTSDGGLLVRISYEIPKDMVQEEIEGISRLLNMFVYGLGGKPKTPQKARRRAKRSGT